MLAPLKLKFIAIHGLLSTQTRSQYNGLDKTYFKVRSTSFENLPEKIDRSSFENIVTLANKKFVTN